MAATVLDVQSMIPNRFQPKQKNRWIFMLEGIDAYIVKTAARPTVTTEEIEIPWINSRRYIAGKTTFGTIPITLHDPIAPSAAQQVMEWLRLCYDSVSGRAGYADFYKRDFAIKLIDPVGTVIEYWDGKGGFVTESNFGELTYENAELIDISLTIRADNFVLQF